MMKGVSKFTVEQIQGWSNDVNIDNKWVPARPYSIPSLRKRIKYAYKVFTGKEDILIWEDQ